MACFAPQNVVLAGMFYAITKGVKNIYLIGVEMDFFKKITVTGQNNVALESIHHYGKEHYTYSQNRFKISEFFGQFIILLGSSILQVNMRKK